jgi:hypothetical protein
MRVPLWAAELAKAFWSLVGEEEPYPRNLRGPIRALPVTVEASERLTAAKAYEWLRANGIACRAASQNRPLRGCLAAQYGYGVLFLDAADPGDEQRFTLAHELAHFLADYWQPRQRVSERVGPAALEVLDGTRLPTAQERPAALFAEVPLGLHLHLMDRNDRQQPIDLESSDAEACADRWLVNCSGRPTMLPPFTRLAAKRFGKIFDQASLRPLRFAGNTSR